MRQMPRPLNRMIGAIVPAIALAIAVSPALAQGTTPSMDGMSNSAAPSTTQPIRAPRTEATPEMIEEAIQRSQARTERLRTTGRPEQWGSEEPFTFDPSKVRR